MSDELQFVGSFARVTQDKLKFVGHLVYFTMTNQTTIKPWSTKLVHKNKPSEYVCASIASRTAALLNVSFRPCQDYHEQDFLVACHPLGYLIVSERLPRAVRAKQLNQPRCHQRPRLAKPTEAESEGVPNQAANGWGNHRRRCDPTDTSLVTSAGNGARPLR